MSEEQTIKSVRKKATQEQTVEAPKTVIYIGESLPNGKLQKNSVFNNGIPKILDEDIEKCPAIKQLMISISSLATANEKIKEKGTLEHTLNAQIKAYVRGES